MPGNEVILATVNSSLGTCGEPAPLIAIEQGYASDPYRMPHVRRDSAFVDLFAYEIDFITQGVKVTRVVGDCVVRTPDIPDSPENDGNTLVMCGQRLSPLDNRSRHSTI